MVMMFRPVERLLDRRNGNVLRSVASMFDKEGRSTDAGLCRAVANHVEGLAMFREESAAAYATSTGMMLGDPTGRPFLDFINGLIDGQVFRRFAEWVFEHKEEILDIVKMIATIIGIFA